MKKIFLFCSIFLISAFAFAVLSPSMRSQAQNFNQPKIKVFILAGQSNMVGATSDCSQISEEFKKTQEDVFWYTENNIWTELDPPTEPLPFSGMGKREKFACGPEVSLGLRLHKVLGEQVALVKYARDGTNLKEEWKVGASLYNNAIARFKQSIFDLQELGYNTQIAGFFWMQGESDARDRIGGESYEANLRHFIDGIRQELDTPYLPFILAKIPLTSAQITTRGSFPYGDRVRNAQLRVAQNTPHTAVFDTLDLPRQEDNVHLTAEGYILLGDRFARVWLLHFFPQPFRFNFSFNLLDIFH